MLKTLSSLKSLKGKRVLLRVDFNVPMNKKKVSDTTRIKETLPTLKHLIKNKARVIIATHMGRPDGKPDAKYKLDPIAKELSKLLKKKVKKMNEIVGPKVEKAIKAMKDGEVLMLENVRFDPREEKSDKEFSKQLATIADLFVNDAFAVSHRDHASVCGVTKYMPSYAGFLVEAEIKNLTPLLKKPARPFTMIIGGAKIDTKIGLIKNFIGVADTIIIGGALANTFLAAEGFNVGKSLYEKEKIPVAQEILMAAEKNKTKIELPLDVVVADEVSEKASTLNVPVDDVLGEMKILDCGKLTIEKYLRIIHNSKTVVWNGPLGLYEFKPFEKGTKAMAKAIAVRKGKVKSYLGGGDTLDAAARFKMKHSNYTFVSTGGGAMLEFLEGKSLPGIVALSRK